MRDLPSTAQLLVSGGDARIALDAVGNRNKYGCQPFPDRQLLPFGSSTASVISDEAYASVERLRLQLMQESGTLESVCAQQMQRIRRELLSDVADLPVELLFATSGTDAHFMVARCLAVRDASPLCIVMVQEEETGSGVAAALTAADVADAGAVVPVFVQKVPLRAGDGQPRLLADIDADVTALTENAVKGGMRVLLVMVDQSKTGLIAPSPGAVIKLHRLYPDSVTVLVDACQFRIAPPTLRVYMQQGFIVALTGSKFLTGPSFSAALLLPSHTGITESRRIEEYGGVGLLLRWEAALVEYRRFRGLPSSTIAGILRDFADAVQARLTSDVHFEPLNVHPLDRQLLTGTAVWDGFQTIFPFVLYRTQSQVGRIPLSRSETLHIYHQLQQPIASDHAISSLRCQLGQPVACGMRGGVPVSALRLCISARLISDAATQKGVAGVIGDAQAVLDKAAWLVDRLAE